MLDLRFISATVDFAEHAQSARVRRRFTSPIALLVADTAAEVMPVLDEADRLARSGLWVVGFVSYDAAPAFDPALAAAREPRLPLACFAAFSHPVVTSHDSDAPPTAHDAPGEPGLLVSEDMVTPAEYHAAVERIREQISAGDVYQVNFTVPFTASSALASSALYDRLRSAQSGRYSAHLDLGELQIISASPELFFERRGDLVRSRPMKGTAPRGLRAAEDDAARDSLLESEKDRAENVMIVDVVRNDIGRIARPGTVRVAALCEPERYPRVWQLTSTVEGRVDPELSVSRVFQALFPPASITGAPKIRATTIIEELETGPRAIYCGAIGMMRPGGDASFNVAIRTAWSADGGRTVHLNAGGGVTIDSTPAGELDELRTKLTAFTVPATRPALFETIRVEHGQPIRVHRHLTRLARSAEYFDLPFSATDAETCIRRAVAAIQELPVARCRIVLSPNGGLDAAAEPFIVASGDVVPRRVVLARQPVHRNDLRLYHKTTDRVPYERALLAAGQVFDVLLWNERREATELTRGNLVAEIDGVRWTPPIECGLLPGTLRAELLESGAIRERVLAVEELSVADRLWFVNSLRGWVEITLGD